MNPRETLVEVLVRRQPLPDAVDWTPLLDQAGRWCVTPNPAPVVVEQGRLAGAVGADAAGDGAGLDGEVGAARRVHAVEAPGEAADLEQRHRRRNVRQTVVREYPGSQYNTRMIRYRVNDPGVVHQTIDGEAVIIHLEHGLYYSLDKVGADVWAAIHAGTSLPALTARLKERYADPGAEIDTAIAALLEELKREELIAEDAAVPGASPEETTSLNGASRPQEIPFERPVLRKYTDLQDLLLLDPIHQVDEAGWPEPKSADRPGSTP